jgi:hypothetical protein
MPYDENYGQQVRLTATIASGVKCSAGVGKISTNADVNQRIDFYRKIKLTSFRCILKEIGMVSHAVSTVQPRGILYDGTNVLATCILGTAAAGILAGGINSTYADVAANRPLILGCKTTTDGTLQTQGVVAFVAHVGYEQRLS